MKKWINRDFLLLPWLVLFLQINNFIIMYCTIQNFGKRKYSKLQVIHLNFFVQNFLLWIIRNIRETRWMALLKYFQLKTTRKQPLRDSNGDLSSKISLSGISSANVCIGNYWTNHCLHTKHSLDALYSWSRPDCDGPQHNFC